MFFPLLLALVPRQAAVQERFEYGQLRHVQLLQPRGEVVRFATQIEIGTMEEPHWPEGEDTDIAIFEGDSTKPVAELAVGSSLIRGFTWTEQPAWHLLELRKATALAVIKPGSPREGRRAGSRLCVLSFPGGEELLSVGGVDEIEDALVRDGRFDLLVRRGGQVLWVRSSETGHAVAMTTIDLGLDNVGCAAFARGGSGERLDAWAVGWKGEELFAVPFQESGAGARRAFRFAFDGGSSGDVVRVGERLRATVWVSESKSHLAVSWPGYCSAVGKLQVIDVSAESKVLWDGRPYPDVGCDQREYGQALAFVPDADEDGVPEILVTGPWSSTDSSIDLLSGSTGSLMKQWSPEDWGSSTGHCLSLSADSRQVLVGGTAFQCYPKDLTEEGQAHLLDVLRMEKLQTWKLSCRKR